MEAAYVLAEAEVCYLVRYLEFGEGFLRASDRPATYLSVLVGRRRLSGGCWRPVDAAIAIVVLVVVVVAKVEAGDRDSFVSATASTSPIGAH